MATGHAMLIKTLKVWIMQIIKKLHSMTCCMATDLCLKESSNKNCITEVVLPYTSKYKSSIPKLNYVQQRSIFTAKRLKLSNWKGKMLSMMFTPIWQGNVMSPYSLEYTYEHKIIFVYNRPSYVSASAWKPIFYFSPCSVSFVLSGEYIQYSPLINFRLIVAKAIWHWELLLIWITNATSQCEK
jgi:hypothetical protein